MSEELCSVCIFNVQEGVEGHSVQVRTNVVPRLGDDVLYYIDYPQHMPQVASLYEGELIRVSGTVARVEIMYCVMRWTGQPKVYSSASVFLINYKAVPVPQEHVDAEEDGE